MPSGRIGAIHHSLQDWYKDNARSLPWRDVQDPYLIWISEVMLQQTQVRTVIPYFKKWRKTFPEIHSLGKATEEDVLKLWEGLGYYSRARNIKKSADIIIDEYGGTVPQEIKLLKRLPGIGDYIAAAIASIAFGKDVPAIEANGLRVIARLFNFHGEVQVSQSKKILKDHLGEIIRIGDAGSINQAVMDLGSLICLPKKPACEICPVKVYCLAFENQTQLLLPVKKKKRPIPHVVVVAAIIMDGSQVLVTKRPPGKLLGGLWEFPGGKVEKGETHQAALTRELREEIGIEAIIGDQKHEYQHAYTHFSVTVFTYEVVTMSGRIEKREVADYKWMETDKLDEIPMGKVDRMISQNLQKELEKGG